MRDKVAAATLPLLARHFGYMGVPGAAHRTPTPLLRRNPESVLWQGLLLECARRAGRRSRHWTPTPLLRRNPESVLWQGLLLECARRAGRRSRHWTRSPVTESPASR